MACNITHVIHQTITSKDYEYMPEPSDIFSLALCRTFRLGVIRSPNSIRMIVFGILPDLPIPAA